MSVAQKRKYSSDPSLRAKELVAEGRLGGKGEGAGRPRKTASERQPKRASAVIAEWARENPQKLTQVFIDVLLDDDANRTDKLRAVKQMVGIDFRESDRERDEAGDPSSPLAQEISADADEAKERLAQMLSDPISGERLRAALAGLLAEAGSTPAISA